MKLCLPLHLVVDVQLVHQGRAAATGAAPPGDQNLAGAQERAHPRCVVLRYWSPSAGWCVDMLGLCCFTTGYRGQVVLWTIGPVMPYTAGTLMHLVRWYSDIHWHTKLPTTVPQWLERISVAGLLRGGHFAASRTLRGAVSGVAKQRTAGTWKQPLGPKAGGDHNRCLQPSQLATAQAPRRGQLRCGCHRALRCRTGGAAPQ
jgi:hypothetical protein